MPRIFRIEWSDDNSGGEELFQQCLGGRTTIALGVAVSQLEQGDHGENNLDACTQQLVKPRTHGWDATVDDVDDDIRVEADHSLKNLRGSGFASGSSGGPSGKKSAPPS